MNLYMFVLRPLRSASIKTIKNHVLHFTYRNFHLRMFCRRE